MSTQVVHLDLIKNFQNSSASFEKRFNLILKEVSYLLDENKVNSLVEWVKTVLQYNVPHGKKIRGKIVEAAFRILSGETDQKTIENVQILGWCVEILQASFLVADDIMDSATIRRGKPCWYKLENVGLMAVNDALLLEHLVYQIIRRRFGSSKMYTSLLEIFFGVTFQTILGQSLDTGFSARLWDSNNNDQPSNQLYHSIASLKTSYYTIYLPIALAMVLAGFNNKEDRNKELWKGLESVALKIGMFFQIQDDYFDCFADEKKLGKMGSDIQEGKCSWLYVKAMELCSLNNHQLDILKENYGRSEPENIYRVKDLYLELGLPAEFRKIQNEMESDIMNSIKRLDNPLLQQVFVDVLYKIFKRVY